MCSSTLLRDDSFIYKKSGFNVLSFEVDKKIAQHFATQLQILGLIRKTYILVPTTCVFFF